MTKKDNVVDREERDTFTYAGSDNVSSVSSPTKKECYFCGSYNSLGHTVWCPDKGKVVDREEKDGLFISGVDNNSFFSSTKKEDVRLMEKMPVDSRIEAGSTTRKSPSSPVVPLLERIDKYYLELVNKNLMNPEVKASIISCKWFIVDSLKELNKILKLEEEKREEISENFSENFNICIAYCNARMYVKRFIGKVK